MAYAFDIPFQLHQDSNFKTNKSIWTTKSKLLQEQIKQYLFKSPHTYHILSFNRTTHYKKTDAILRNTDMWQNHRDCFRGSANISELSCIEDTDDSLLNACNQTDGSWMQGKNDEVLNDSSLKTGFGLRLFLGNRHLTDWFRRAPVRLVKNISGLLKFPKPTKVVQLQRRFSF